MSHRAWVYIWGVLVTGAVLSLLALMEYQQPHQSELLTFVVLVAMGSIAQLFEAEHGRQSYYPHFVFFFAGVILLHPFLFIFLVTVPHVVEWVKTWVTKSQHLRSWYIQPFNIATHILAGSAAHMGYSYVESTVDPMLTLAPVLAATVAVASYVLVNHVLVGLALVLARSISFRQSGVMAVESLLPDFIMSFLGYIVAVLWALNPWLTLPALSPLVLMYRALMVPQLKQEAQTDGKTGLWNARHFSTLFTAEMERAQRFSRPLAVIMADLDLLRNINNTYGHLAGDAVLAKIGQILRDTIREYDIAGRFGGEEFAIVLPETEPAEAREVAERVRAAVEAAEFEVSTSTTPLHVTMSCGVASFPGDAGELTALVHEADVAVYQAKLKGRNCVVCAADVPHFVKLEQQGPVQDRVSAPYAAAFMPRPIARPIPRADNLTATRPLDTSKLSIEMLTQSTRPLNSGNLNLDMLDADNPIRVVLTSGPMAGRAPLSLSGPLKTTVLSSIDLDAAAENEEGRRKREEPAPVENSAAGANPDDSSFSHPPSTFQSDRLPPLPLAHAPAEGPGANGGVEAQASPVTPERRGTPERNTQPVPRGTAGWWSMVFVGAVVAAGAAITTTGFALGPAPDLGAIALLMLLAAVAEVFKIDMYGDNTLSVSVAVAFAAALIAGIPGVALVSAAIVLAHRVQQRPLWDRATLYKTPYNWATHVLAGATPALAFAGVDLKFGIDTIHVLAAATAVSAFAYFSIDTGLIAGAVSLSRGTSAVDLWRNQFKWLASHYLVLCTLGLFLSLAYSSPGVIGLTGILVFALPVFMMRYAQKQYVERTESSVRELKRMNGELVRANEEVMAASKAMHQLNDELFVTLSKIIDARDPYVGGHAAKVSDYATAIARELGLPEPRMEPLRQAGFLHDIGKIGISEQVLHKPAQLTREEYEYVKTHAALGGEFLETCASLRHLAPFVRHHHERWDGKGYPRGLRGEEIPLEARILAVCDAVEAMASDRPYRKARSLPDVIAEVRRAAGTQFDPAVAEAFITIAERERENLVINSAQEVLRRKTEHSSQVQPHNNILTAGTGPLR